MPTRQIRITFVLIALVSVFTLSSCFNMLPCIKGSGDIVKEERDVKEFDRIELESSGDIYFKQGDINALRIEADDNIIDLVKTKVDGKTLRIYSEKNICPEKLRFDIILKDLRSLTISGSGNIKCLNDLISDDFYISILGSGDILIPRIKAENISLDVSGSGDIFIEGKAKKIVSEINGSGNINCLGLKVKKAKIVINGSGDFSIYTEEKLYVEINGSGDIIYKGNPKHVVEQINGSGYVRKK